MPFNVQIVDTSPVITSLDAPKAPNRPGCDGLRALQPKAVAGEGATDVLADSLTFKTTASKFDVNMDIKINGGAVDEISNEKRSFKHTNSSSRARKCTTPIETNLKHYAKISYCGKDASITPMPRWPRAYYVQHFYSCAARTLTPPRVIRGRGGGARDGQQMRYRT